MWGRECLEWEMEHMAALINLLSDVNLQRNKEDRWVCEENEQDMCIVKAAYLNFDIQLSPMFTQLWSLKLPPKVSYFICRACTNSLPTRDNLKYRGIIM